MKKEINPKDGVHGRWYLVQSFIRWLIKFDRVQEGKLYDLMCYNLDHGEKGDSTKPLSLSVIESFIEATPEEVEKYFPGEFKKEPTTKEEIMQECIRRFPKGSKVKCANSGMIYTVANSFTTPDTNDWLEGVYYCGSGTNVLAVKEGSSTGFHLYINGEYATLVEEPENTPLDKLKELKESQPEALQQSADKVNAMEQPDERSVYVYTDKDDGIIYMTPKFDPHVGGHIIDEVLSKAEDNSVIYEARPVGVKKIYLEKV